MIGKPLTSEGASRFEKAFKELAGFGLSMMLNGVYLGPRVDLYGGSREFFHSRMQQLSS